jgi:hypothetical protein
LRPAYRSKSTGTTTTTTTTGTPFYHSAQTEKARDKRKQVEASVFLAAFFVGW